MKTKLNLIQEKHERLKILQSQSNRAIDIVTSTINQLEATNVEIDSTITDIQKDIEDLRNAELGLNKTRLHNTKIISKFKNLIEEE